MVPWGLIVAAALSVRAVAVQTPVACTAPPAQLVKAVSSAPAPRLTPQQKAVFDRLVAAVRAGNAAAARQQLSSLIQLRAGATQPGDACALVLRAVRLGKLEGDPRLQTALQAAPATPGDTTGASRDYQSALDLLTGISRQMWQDAVQIIANLKA